MMKNGNGHGNGHGTNGRGPAVKPGEFATPDLYFAAYLQTAGVQLLRHERWEGRIHFTFDTTISNIEELKTAWISNTGKVFAQQYSHNIKSLKSVCHM